MTGFPINPPREPIAGSQGMVSPAWYRFFVAIQQAVGSGVSSPFDDSALMAAPPANVQVSYDDAAFLSPPAPPPSDDNLLQPYFTSAAFFGLEDGDKGDISVSGLGSTWTIDAGAVSLAKMADVATASVFYRKTAGTGVPEVQSLATLKADLGLTGTNSGDQTSIVGISGTKAQFNTAVSDGDILFVGDVTQYTDEMAQDAVGAMVDATLTYTDATPLLSRSALTGAITAAAGSNATALGSFTTAQLNSALSDGDLPSAGIYTPTLTNTTNVSASTANANTMYKRTGDLVDVSGQVAIQATGAGAIVLKISLPIASNFSATSQAGGTIAAVQSGKTASGGILADTANDVLEIRIPNVPDATNIAYSFHATYRII